jgi:hypothetical protein
MINNILAFFNKIMGLVIFLIFIVVFMEHIHHAHHHGHFNNKVGAGDSTMQRH